MTLDELIARPPLLHTDRAGNLTSWRASEELLRCIDRLVEPGARTLETGAGLSTIVFALNMCDHTTVVPDQTQVERIVQWCTHHGIDTGRINFIVDRSEDVLPQLTDDALDAVLIDGGHGFPTPFIDWYYSGQRVRAGGVVIVDDTHLWTGRVLKGYLDADASWTLIGKEAMQYAVFRRDGQQHLGDWTDQPYVLRRSFAPNSTRLVGRQVAMGAIWLRRARTLATLLRAGDLQALGQKLRVPFQVPVER